MVDNDLTLEDRGHMVTLLDRSGTPAHNANMSEILMTELDLSNLGDRSVSSGEIKRVPLALAYSGIGIFFPGVSACLPTVIWSPTAPDVLAMHIASPLNTPNELERAIAAYKSQNPLSGASFHISSARVISPEEYRIAKIPGRKENEAYLRSLTTIKKIFTDLPLGVNLSFHPAHGFQIVRT